MLSWDEVDNEDTGAAVIKGANSGHAGWCGFYHGCFGNHRCFNNHGRRLDSWRRSGLKR